MPASTAATQNVQSQSPSAQSASGNSWVGLLVATGCTNPGASSGAVASTGSAMTGPALNGSSGSGMNGTSTDMTGSSANGVSQTRTDMPRASDTYGSADRMTGDVTSRAATDQGMAKSTQNSGDMNRATNYTAGMRKNSSDTGDSWDHAKMVASELGPNCHISSTTSSFALMLPDGRTLSFDSASNSKIADQVRDRVSGNTTKIFRVEVKGTLSGDTITVDSIRM